MNNIGYWKWMYQNIRSVFEKRRITAIKAWYKEYKGVIEMMIGFVGIFLSPLAGIISPYLTLCGVVASILVLTHAFYLMRE